MKCLAENILEKLFPTLRFQDLLHETMNVFFEKAIIFSMICDIVTAFIHYFSYLFNFISLICIHGIQESVIHGSEICFLPVLDCVFCCFFTVQDRRTDGDHVIINQTGNRCVTCSDAGCEALRQKQKDAKNSRIVPSGMTSGIIRLAWRRGKIKRTMSGVKKDLSLKEGEMS